MKPTGVATALLLFIGFDHCHAGEGAIRSSSNISVSATTLASLVYNRPSTASSSSARTPTDKFPRFFSYEPITDVGDHAAIDSDQKEMTIGLMKHTQQGFEAAERIYEQGAHSRSYAFIKTDKPFDRFIPRNTTLIGQTSSNQTVHGISMGDVQEGEDIVAFLYGVVGTALEANFKFSCHVGGSFHPKLKGCLAPSGILQIGGDDDVLATTSSESITYAHYQYDPMTDNRNGRTFEKMSKETGEKMSECVNGRCNRDQLQLFFEYYGNTAYADEWVRAALNGIETTFTHGNSDFGILPREGRAEAVRRGTVVMSLWMHIIRKMEYAVDNCVEGCYSSDCGFDHVHNWDQAVAFYTGAYEQSGRKGYLLYSVANQLCARFGTCFADQYKNNDDDETNNGDWHLDVASIFTANANVEAFVLFDQGQKGLLQGDCSKARLAKRRIVQLMTVPLVQGLIRSAHSLDVRKDTRPHTVAEGATYAASVLPLVHSCNPKDARIIDEYMNVGRTTMNSGAFGVDFKEVKAAVERNYECMGLTCKDVGGLLEITGSGYQHGASPCTDSSNYDTVVDQPTSQYSSKHKIAAALLITITVVCCFGFLVTMHLRGLGKKALAKKSLPADEKKLCPMDESATTLDTDASEMQQQQKHRTMSYSSPSLEDKEFRKIWEEEFGGLRTTESTETI